MNISICEHACGRTSLDIDADIQKVSVSTRINGSEESNWKASIEVCKECRASLNNSLIGLFNPKPFTFRLESPAINMPYVAEGGRIIKNKV